MTFGFGDQVKQSNPVGCDSAAAFAQLGEHLLVTDFGVGLVIDNHYL